MTTAPLAPKPSVNTPTGRLMSLDALRGFDMLWILGADEVAYALRQMEPTPPTRFIADQLEHVPWAGLHFYDVIFPLFVFITGVALVFSLSKIIAQHGARGALRRIWIRAIVLFLLGIFYNGGLSAPWPDVRLLGVLQRIAIAYAAAGTLFVFLRPRALAFVAVAVLVVYWALLTYVPVRALPLDATALATELGPDEPHRADPNLPSVEYQARVRERFDATTARVTGRYKPGLNLANQIDFTCLPGRKYDVYWDPEGLLSSLPAIVTCLAGVFAGMLLRSTRDATQMLRWLVIGGLLALLLGYAWGLSFPIIKKIWTSSFVLVTAGWSTLLLAMFYYLVEMRGWKRWCAPFVWIGMNPITLYLATAVVGFHGIARRLVGGSVQDWLNQRSAGLGELVVACTTLCLLVALAKFLQRRGIFLKV